MQKVIQSFLTLSGLILLFTSIAKLVSANSDARLFEIQDPIFTVSFKSLFWIVGLLEFAVALFCFFGKQAGLQVAIVASLATSFFAYRIALFCIGYHRPCGCMGNFTDALHLSPQSADTIMKAILTFLLIGSYASLFWLWRQRKNAASAVPTTS